MSNEHLEAAQRLAEILAQENSALQRLDFASASAFVTAKDAALDELVKQPRPAASTPRSTALARRLGELAAENQVLLERAIAVQTRVVRIVARAAAPAPAMTRYSGYAARAPSNRATAMAISTRA